MDVKEENLDELLEKAELEAAGDEVVSSGRNLSDSDNENEEKENISELYVSDDDTVIIGGDLMENLNDDLNSFLTELLGDDK